MAVYEAAEALCRRGPDEMLQSPERQVFEQVVCVVSVAIFFVVQFCQTGQLATNYLLSNAEWVLLAATACFQLGLETEPFLLEVFWLSTHSAQWDTKTLSHTSTRTVQHCCPVLQCALALFAVLTDVVSAV